jgi:hypothetical protein
MKEPELKKLAISWFIDSTIRNSASQKIGLFIFET